MEITDHSTSFKRIIVTCSKRLSLYLEMEIVELGFIPVRTFATGVEIFGTMNDCIRLNLNLRCASQVLYSLKEFPCNSPDDVYRELFKISWEKILSNDSYFSVTSNVDHPSINNSLYANVKVKDAIVDRMRNKTGGRPNSGSSVDAAVIHLFWKNEIAEIFIDTSGETLAKHGYRKIPGKAPMLEALAAATILATRWDRRSTFINPMCGSGTLAIEATLIATNRRPGLFRDNYAFMHIKDFDDIFLKKKEQILSEKIIELPDLKVIATDISEDAINISKINAGAAGIQNYIEFIRCNFEETPIPENTNGIVF
ncbi:MAG: class I SAM-dependent RNA methyltransferase [Chitinophagaceae bacterium]